MSSPIPVAAPIDVSNPSTQPFGFALPCNNEVVFDAGYVRGGAGTQGGNIYGTWPEVLQTLGTLLVGASASTQLIKVQVDASLPAMPTFALSYPRIVGANTPTSVHPPYPTLDLGSTSFTFTGELQVEDCDITASAGGQISATATTYPTIRLYGPAVEGVVFASGTSVALVDLKGMSWIVYLNNAVLGDSINPVFTDSVGGGAVTIVADTASAFYDTIFDGTIDVATSVFADVIGPGVTIESAGSMAALLGNTTISPGASLSYVSTDPVTAVQTAGGGSPTVGAFVVNAMIGLVYVGQGAEWNPIVGQSGTAQLSGGVVTVAANILSSSKVFLSLLSPIGTIGTLAVAPGEITPGSPGSFTVRSFVSGGSFGTPNPADDSEFYWQVLI